MKKYMLLSKKNLSTLVERFLKEFQVYGPTEKNGIISFDIISDWSELKLDASGVPLLPPKKIFFPPEEVLFTFKISDDNNIEIEDPLDKIKEKKRVLIGIRPCDAHGLTLLDKVFIGKTVDPYYVTRRENTIIICITCNNPTEYCFCNFTKSGPSIKEGFDLLLTDIGEFFFVEIGSERGKDIINSNLDLFQEASENDLARRDQKIREVEEKLSRNQLTSSNELYQKLIRAFNDELWNEYGRRCVACGKCNFTCPTCHCFDVYDVMELTLREGKRVRKWDACHFLSFTRVAGGEIFRKERTSRVKQRIYDKYCYPVDEFGSIFCVGCGRCIHVCTAGIDIREILKKVLGM